MRKYNNIKMIIERFIGTVNNENVDKIKIHSDELSDNEFNLIKEDVHKNTTKPKIIYKTDELDNKEERLFKSILLHNKIDPNFKGILEIHEIN